MTSPEPITVTLNIGLDTPISDRYVQTSEDGFSHTGQVTVLDAVIDRAASMFVEDVRRNSEMYQSVRQRVADTREAMIRESLAGPIAEALASSVQRTNAYGVPQGEPLPMIEIVIEQMHQLLTKPSGNSFDNRGKTLLQSTVEAEVTKAFKKELADELGEAKAEIRAAVKATAVTALTEAIASQFGVR